MLLVHLAQLVVLHGVVCLDAQLEGNLALDLQVARIPAGKGRWHRVAWEAGSQDAHELVIRMSEQRPKVTLATQLECVYQFPEQTQVDALLSNMMNELAKVFVRANEYMKKRFGTRRDENGLKQASHKDFTMDITFGMRATDETELVREEKKEPVTEKLKVKLTRFKVVHKKQKPFFDLIYSNMTDEYRNFYNTTFERVNRAGQDPCSRQAEVKQLWRELLQHAHDTLLRAAQRCVDEYLTDTPTEKKPQVRKRLQKFLKTEFSKMRANQLNMLCDIYQLCYNDLLE